MSTDPVTAHRGRMALRAGRYVSQFLGVGFFFTALGGILRERGASLTVLGVLNVFLLMAIAKTRLGVPGTRWPMALPRSSQGSGSPAYAVLGRAYPTRNATVSLTVLSEFPE